MKSIFKVIVAMLFAVGILNAQPISQTGEKGGYTIKLTSEKSLVVGENDIFVELFKDGQTVTNAKVKSKFFMPEMPGMPYMEYKDKAKLVNGKYKMMINFTMGGTWQYQLKFKTKEGKVHTVRGSVNI
ncbi:FixH family protein [Arcobacter sp. YIC-310]|uniref:FixH family protein n=1 Tax=Arcobacter sp. YIC-310 TaxID=3376632 RepID=UPI003C14E783